MSNAVTVVGNLTRDPELRFTASGIATTSFGVAVNRRWKKGDEWEEATSFFNVVCWRELADNVAATLTKGSRAIIQGRLEQRTYENKEGATVNVVEIVADEIGPSLRFATADVSRVEREKSDGAQQRSRPGAQKPRPKPPAEDYDYGEEPF